MENDIIEIKETLKRATALLAKVSEDTSKMKGDIKTGREIQDMHTTAFDKLAKHLGLDLENI